MAKLITGKVTSAKPDKSIVITVTSRQTHPLYKKQYSVNSKYMAHDEKNEAKAGDIVTIRETRPLSARKRFTLDKILETAAGVYNEADARAGVEEIIEPKEKKAEKPEVSKPAVKVKEPIKEAKK